MRKRKSVILKKVAYLQRAIVLHVLLVVKHPVPHWQVLLLLALLWCHGCWIVDIDVRSALQRWSEEPLLHRTHGSKVEPWPD